MSKGLAILLGLFCCLGALAKEVIPPKPANYFNDYAHVTSDATAASLNHTLADFERQTSSQLLVAVFPKMESDSSVDDYAVRVFRAWGVGQKDKNNGAVLFVFVQDHKMFIEVGYGLEGVLPDITCKRIVSDEIAPHFKQGDYEGGLSAGVAAMIAATKNEYKGTGRTVADNQGTTDTPVHLSPAALIFLFIFICIMVSVFARMGRRGGFFTGWMLGSGGFGGWSGGSGGSGGGGWSGGGGGGGDSFSGGGGSSGGGGAGGSW